MVTTTGATAAAARAATDPYRPEWWHAIELHGTAETVEQPP